MKIDISHIVAEHLGTLRNARTQKISAGDIFLFYMIPLLAGTCTYYFAIFNVSKDICNASITFFGVFVALLLKIQVAVFGVFQRKRATPEDERLIDAQRQNMALRRQVLLEINSNISYLIVISCFALIMFLILLTVNSIPRTAAALVGLLYSHFMLTLLMIVKRTHTLFEGEYRHTP